MLRRDTVQGPIKMISFSKVDFVSALFDTFEY